MAQVESPGAVRMGFTQEERDIVEDHDSTPSEVVRAVIRQMLVQRARVSSNSEMSQIDGFIPGSEAVVAVRRPKRYEPPRLWVHGIEDTPGFEDAVVVIHNSTGDCLADPDCPLNAITQRVTDYIIQLGRDLEDAG